MFESCLQLDIGGIAVNVRVNIVVEVTVQPGVDPVEVQTGQRHGGG